MKTVYVQLKVALPIGTVRAVGAGEGLFPSVNPDVAPQVFGEEEPLAAVGTHIAGPVGKPQVAAQQTGHLFCLQERSLLMIVACCLRIVVLHTRNHLHYCQSVIYIS